MSGRHDDDERAPGGRPLLYGKALQVRLSPEMLDRINTHGRGDFLSEKIRELLEAELGSRERRAKRKAIRDRLAKGESEDETG